MYDLSLFIIKQKKKKMNYLQFIDENVLKNKDELEKYSLTIKFCKNILKQIIIYEQQNPFKIKSLYFNTITDYAEELLSLLTQKQYKELVSFKKKLIKHVEKRYKQKVSTIDDVNDLIKLNRKQSKTRSPLGEVPFKERNAGKTICFQIFDIMENYIFDQDASIHENPNIEELCIFGRLQNGDSICCRVRNVPVHIYCAIPDEWDDFHCEQIRRKMNTSLLFRNQNNEDCKLTDCHHHHQEMLEKEYYTKSIYNEPCKDFRKQDVVAVYSFEIIENKYKTFVGYQPKPQKFVRFELASCYYVNYANKFLLKELGDELYNKHYTTHEVCNKPIDNFMRTMNLAGHGWIEIETPRNVAYDKRISNSNYEVIINKPQRQIKLREDLNRIQNAPYILCNFDLETYDLHADKSYDEGLYSVAFQTKKYKDNGDEELSKVVLTYGKVGVTKYKNQDYKVKNYHNERQLIHALWKYIIEYDVDIITGWNINSFDLKYLYERCELLKLDFFPYLSKFRYKKTFMLKRYISSNQMGGSTEYTYQMPGRITLDALKVFKSIITNFKLYNLGYVAQELFGQTKEDMPYKQIRPHFYGTKQMRAKLMKYNIVDVELVTLILEKKSLITVMIEEAKVFRCRLIDILNRGKQFKLSRKFRQYTYAKNFLFPCFKKKKGYKGDDLVEYPDIPYYNGMKGCHNLAFRDRPSNQKVLQVFDEHGKMQQKVVTTSKAKKGKTALYEGAYVFNPIKGFYTKPVAILDFKSLYPSEMIAHNLGPTALLQNKEHGYKLGLKDDDMYCSPEGYWFVKRDIFKAILAEVSKELLAERAATKKEMKKAKKEGNKGKASILDGQQLAIKMCANSIYGGCGSYMSEIYCIPVAASITACGREDIKKAEKFVMKPEYAKYKPQVIYGDTDSIMVCLHGCETNNDGCNAGIEMAEAMNTCGMYISPMEMEAEAIYNPYLLLKKKRYMCLGHEILGKDSMTPAKMKQQGTSLKRRDRCDYIQKIGNDLSKFVILESKSKDFIMDYLKEKIQNLLLGEVDAKLLERTNKLSKPRKHYDNPAAHINAYDLWNKYECNEVPLIGERFSFIMCKTVETIANKKIMKAAHKGMPLELYKNKNLVVDNEFYFDDLQKVIKGHFSEFLSIDDIERLFDIKRYKTIKYTKFVNLNGFPYYTKEDGKSIESIVLFNAPITNLPTKRKREEFIEHEKLVNKQSTLELSFLHASKKNKSIKNI